MNIDPNANYSFVLTITPEMTASALGSGDMDVLATPAMIAAMEHAAMLAVAPGLDEGETTVGSAISTTHEHPSIVGQSFIATARLTAQEGRRLEFDIEARDAVGQCIGQGKHTRYVVKRERFLSPFKK